MERKRESVESTNRQIEVVTIRKEMHRQREKDSESAPSFSLSSSLSSLLFRFLFYDSGGPSTQTSPSRLTSVVTGLCVRLWTRSDGQLRVDRRFDFTTAHKGQPPQTWCVASWWCRSWNCVALCRSVLYCVVLCAAFVFHCPVVYNSELYCEQDTDSDCKWQRKGGLTAIVS